MTDDLTPDTTDVPETPETTTQAPKKARAEKLISITNNSAAPITLRVGRDEPVTFLPSETVQVTKSFLTEIKKNSAAMTFFNPKELVEA